MPPAPITNTLFYGDNLDILRDYIASESVDLIYLDPPFGRLKSLLRRAATRSRDTLHTAIAPAIDHITTHDAHGFFGRCGYGRKVQSFRPPL